MKLAAEGQLGSSFINTLFYDEPPGSFSNGHIFISAPDVTAAEEDSRAGYWHCDITDQNKLTWSEKVYELFGLPAGTLVTRDWAVARYDEQSKVALERVRKFGLSRGFGFILDAMIRPDGAGERWIRVLAVPIFASGRVVGLHGLKRAL